MSRYTSAKLYIKSEDAVDTAAWFEHILGAERIAQSTISESPLIELELAGMSIIVTGTWQNELPLPACVQPRYGVDSLRLAVANLDAEIETLRARGCVFLGEMETLANKRTVFVEGPERIRIQISEA